MKNFDILKVSARANSSNLNLPLYNGTAGMLFDEDGKLYNFKSVRKELENISSSISFMYQPSSGSEEHKEAIKKYIFNSFNKDLINEYDAVITLGGTGALSLISMHHQSRNIILPNICWSNYVSIFQIKDPISYEVFDINSIKNALNKSKKEKDETILLINDPAQNPLGYTMNKEEYSELTELLNEYVKEHDLVLIMDIAYSDYGEDPCLPFSGLNNLDSKIKVYYTFSASKSFGIYSLRTGALLFKKDKDLVEKYSSIARSVYSCPTNIGSQLIYNIMNNEDLYKSFQEDLLRSKVLLKERSKVLLNLLDQCNIEYFPYKDGFYITLKNIDNAYKLCELLEERNCFIIPLNEHMIRIAICSLKTSSIKPMIELINEVKNEI